jgi:hypothetical protein
VKYFANPVKGSSNAMANGLLSFIDTPKQGNLRPAGVEWCADNGCFGKGYPGDEAWFAWLEANAYAAADCVFATAPDVVGDAEATVARSMPWLAKIRSLGYPAAFVAQNGLENLDVPWDDFDVLFIGGTVECADHGPTLDAIKTGRGGNQRFYCPTCRVEIFEWKESQRAAELIRQAKAHGKWVHCGRVNSFERLLATHLMGCDSADGTYLVFGPKKNLPKLLGWLRAVNNQCDLLGESA